MIIDQINSLVVVPVELDEGLIQHFAAHYDPSEVPDMEELKWGFFKKIGAGIKKAAGKVKAAYDKYKEPVKKGLHVAAGVAGKVGGVASKIAGNICGAKCSKDVDVGVKVIEKADELAQKYVKLQQLQQLYNAEQAYAMGLIY